MYSMQKYFTFSFTHEAFEIQCVFYTSSTSRFRLTTFQVLRSHVGLWLLWWTRRSRFLG